MSDDESKKEAARKRTAAWVKANPEKAKATRKRAHDKKREQLKELRIKAGRHPDGRKI